MPDKAPDEAPTSKRTEYPTVSEEALRGVVRTRFDSPEPTKAQLERRHRNTESIRDLGLPVLETLPVVEDAANIKPRTEEEVSRRCFAIAICAVKGETNDEEFVKEVIAGFGAKDFFSPQEQAFIKSENPSEQDRINFAWQYECVHVLLWALGYLDELRPPNQICDVSKEMAILREHGPEKPAGDAKMRSLAEILDAADLYYRLHWAAIELQINGKESPAVDEGIVRERHRALNCLIRYMDQTWDDVTTDT